MFQSKARINLAISNSSSLTEEAIGAEEGFIFSEEVFEVTGTGGHQVANHLGGFLSTAQAHSEDFELQSSAQGEQAIGEDLVRGGGNE